MKKAALYFKGIKLARRKLTKLRGYIGEQFKKHDLIHNHSENGKEIYRYPLIQIKLIDNIPAMIAVTDEAVKIFTEIFMSLDKIEIGYKNIPIHEKDIKIEKVEIGFSEKMIKYEFTSFWIGLNQQKYELYQRTGELETRQKILESCLIGNILSMAKGLGVWLNEDQRLKVKLDVRSRPVKIKNTPLLGFNGVFKTNFVIPDYLGLGKSVSRGFGTVKRVL